MDAFAAANYPSREPCELVAGDRWAWKRPELATTYPPASYTLKYAFRLFSAGTEIEITSTAADFVVEVGSAATAAFTAGRYAWQAYITRNADSERITVGNGALKILSNNDAATADPRSHARIMLDAIESALEGRATAKQLDLISAGEADRNAAHDPAFLSVQRDKYRAEVAQEEAAEKVAQGLGDSRRIYTRFAR